MLDTIGSRKDLEALGDELCDGLEVIFYTDDGDDIGRPDDLEVRGWLRMGRSANSWLGEFDPTTFSHASERKA